MILDDCFEAHLDRFRAPEYSIFLLSSAHSFKPGVAKVNDIDLVMRTAELDKTEAVGVLLLIIEQRTPKCADWPDDLAAELIQDPSLKLSFWARQKDLSPWTVSRGFTRVSDIPLEQHANSPFSPRRSRLNRYDADSRYG